MKTQKTYLIQILISVFLFLWVGMLLGCSDDEIGADEIRNGIIQFRLYKKNEQNLKSTNAPLNKLHDAKKLRVVLHDAKNNTISQTLILEAYDAETAEYGLTSEKLKLQEGNYLFIGYYLYNAKDEVILSGEPNEAENIEIEKGGLFSHAIYVDAVNFGRVQLVLRKELITKQKNTLEEAAPSFPFRLIKEVDITLKNLFTKKETLLENLKVSYEEEFEGEASGSKLTAKALVDSVIGLEAGNYCIVKYEITNSGGSLVYDSNSDVKENQFEIIDNELVEANVPISIFEVAPHIQDYVALKSIWEALDGENWSYRGDTYPDGINWDFNKELDMWGEQPGVRMDATGRITGLTIGGFGPKGIVPDEIGMLTELKTLILAQVADFSGNVIPSGNEENTRKSFAENANSLKQNEDRMHRFYEQHRVNPVASFSEIIQRSIAHSKGILYQPADVSKPDLTPYLGTYTNEITRISNEVKQLKKLTQFSIANSPIAEIPDVLDELPELTDVHVCNCPNISTFPDVLTRLEKLIALEFALNPQIPSDDLLSGLDKMAVFEEQKSEKTIQILTLGYNSLKTLPQSFSKLERLGGLDCVSNQIETLPALGMNVSPIVLMMDNNKIHTIETDADGNYCKIDDLETFSLGGNQLTEFPDIFDAKSIYAIKTINFSDNLIENIECERGVNVEMLLLAGNKLTTFPSVLFDIGSTVSFLNLSRNQISKFSEKSFEGENAYMMTAIDLSFNHLNSLAKDLNNRTLPYLNGLDLSYNRFDRFPFQPLNIKGLGIYGVRCQRNEDGYRCLKEWPEGAYIHIGLRSLWLGGNDIGKVPETDRISEWLNYLDIADNPGIILNLSSVCSRIGTGRLILNYDSSQDLRGCDHLNLD